MFCSFWSSFALQKFASFLAYWFLALNKCGELFKCNQKIHGFHEGKNSNTNFWFVNFTKNCLKCLQKGKVDSRIVIRKSLIQTLCTVFSLKDIKAGDWGNSVISQTSEFTGDWLHKFSHCGQSSFLMSQNGVRQTGKAMCVLLFDVFNGYSTSFKEMNR